MNILISNDDGIFSEGIISLAKLLLKKGNKVCIYAPSGNRSGASHSMNFCRDIKVEEVNLIDGVKSYSLSGSPADAVRFGLSFAPFKIDCVFCGINKGSNIGHDVEYSGTVNACMEGLEQGYKTVAISNISWDDTRYDYTLESIDIMYDYIIENMSTKFVLNINFPNVPYSDIKGVKICKAGKCVYDDRYEMVANGVYQLVGPIVPDTEETDGKYAFDGFVTLSPIVHIYNDEKLLKEIKEYKK